MKKLALVLGGGAAKGYAHVGILKVLEKNNIRPDLIVGTSMGALVGGMYASGKTPQQLEEIASKFNSMGNFSLISTLFKGNVLNISKVKELLKKELGDKKFEECQIPFVAVATELNTGKEYHFKEGLLKDGIMASISIPGVFPSVKIGDNTYCDGGMLNNLPEDIARKMMPDAVIVSVDVLGDYALQVEKIKMKTIETFLNASTLMITNIMKSKEKLADLRITMSMPHVSQLDFSSKISARTIKKGENFARAHLATIKNLLKD